MAVDAIAYTSSEELLRIENLKVHFPIRQGFLNRQVAAVHAVDDVSLTIHSGETVGVLGESGCGKTTLGRAILRLVDHISGRIVWVPDNTDIVPLSQRQVRPYRRNLQVIFQDPFSSLNPRMTIGDIVGEPLLVFKLCRNSDERRSRVAQLLEEVGLDPAAVGRYPHEFSGGQRQRIGIARALALQPRLIIADEPVSALDVSIQAQIINLLQDLQQSHQLSYLFIAHDPAVIEHISDRVAVMYLGQIVELASREALFAEPLHPYTQALFQSAPVADPGLRSQDRQLLQGDVPSPVSPPPGCRFHTRCPHCFAPCPHHTPRLLNLNGHHVACHLYDQS